MPDNAMGAPPPTSFEQLVAAVSRLLNVAWTLIALLVMAFLGAMLYFKYVPEVPADVVEMCRAAVRERVAHGAVAGLPEGFHTHQGELFPAQDRPPHIRQLRPRRKSFHVGFEGYLFDAQRQGPRLIAHCTFPPDTSRRLQEDSVRVSVAPD